MAESQELIEAEALVQDADNFFNFLQDRVLRRLEVTLGRGPIVLPVLALDLNCEALKVDGFPGDTLITNMLRALCSGLQGVINTLDGLLEGLIASVTDAINAIIGGVAVAIEALFDALTGSISDLIDSILDKMEEIVTRIISTIETIVDAFVVTVTQVSNAIVTAITNVLSALNTGIGALLNKIGDLVSSVTNDILRVLDAITNSIETVIDALVKAAESIFNTIEAGFTRLIEVIIGGVESGLGAIERVIESVPSAIKEIGTNLIEGLETGIAKPLTTLGTLLFEQIDKAIDDMLKDKNITVEDTVTKLLTQVGVPQPAIDRVRASIEGVTPDAQVITMTVLMGVLTFALPTILSTVTTPALEGLSQEVRGIVRQALIPVPDTLEAFYRGEVDRAFLDKELHQAGLQNNKIEVLLATGRRFVQPQELVRWWLRGSITEQELEEGLIGQRIRPQDVPVIKEAAFFIPGPNDLIRFAVREVFSPSIRQEFGLDDDFPTEFAENAKKVGLSEEWARAFWASHWILPSTRMGFEMLHRRFIEEDQLDVLLRIQDVMPFWRENIKKIAFRPITRVDVRRFHKLNLVTEEELTLRYRDIGYSPADAARMTEFTVAFNSPDEPENKDTWSGISRAIALSLLDDGAITESDSREVLRGLGYSDSLADLLVDQRLLEGERANRKLQADAIADQVKSGAITFEAAQDALNSLGFEPAELERILSQITRDLARRDKLPDIKLLSSLLSGDLINGDKFKETLQRSGFSDEWAELILKNEQAG